MRRKGKSNRAEGFSKGPNIELLRGQRTPGEEEGREEESPSQKNPHRQKSFRGVKRPGNSKR